MIYCVEDDNDIRELVIYTLNTMGMEACGFEKGELCLEALESETPELILLDIMLPGKDGIEILEQLKKSPKTKMIPVIMMTAKGAEYDVVKGLDMGADDYVTKPFGMMEMVSRIKAVLRRTSKVNEETELVAGDVRLDSKKHEVRVHGERITLTVKEFELLRHFLQNPELVLTRDMLLEKVWGYEFAGESRTLDVHIRTLRQKLGKAGEMIKTVRGVGYRLGGIHEEENS